LATPENWGTLAALGAVGCSLISLVLNLALQHTADSCPATAI